MGTICRIYLLRHGRTDSNAAGRLMGQLDEPLTDYGRNQARAAAASLAGRGISAIYASDLRRAHETAEIVGSRLGLRVQPAPGLREINMGDWAGRTYAEVQEHDPDGYAAVRANPAQNGPRNGESEGQLAARVWQALAEIAAVHPGGTVLAVTHGGPLRSIAGRVIGDEQLPSSRFAVDNCGVMLLEWTSSSRRLLVPSPVTTEGAS